MCLSVFKKVLSAELVIFLLGGITDTLVVFLKTPYDRRNAILPSLVSSPKPWGPESFQGGCIM